MKNTAIVCTPGYPMSRGTAARMAGEAFLVKTVRGGNVHAIKPALRERAVASFLPQVQTIDPTSIMSALTRERGT